MGTTQKEKEIMKGNEKVGDIEMMVCKKGGD